MVEKPLNKIRLTALELQELERQTEYVKSKLQTCSLLFRPSFGELSSRMWQVLEEASRQNSHIQSQALIRHAMFRDDYTKLEKEYYNYIQLYTTSYEMLQGTERDHVKQNDLGTGRPYRTQRGQRDGLELREV